MISNSPKEAEEVYKLEIKFIHVNTKELAKKRMAQKLVLRISVLRRKTSGYLFFSLHP